MASQTRPEPMNASPYHSKVRVTLKFSDTQFPAGSMVTGKVELECKAEKGLGISVIMVELYAIEGEIIRPHMCVSFLHSFSNIDSTVLGYLRLSDARCATPS